ncbi:MAG: hypothetical protein COB12_06230 [Flavobacterium sp.]|nr:MAG: hypothetical protein COB12_06230 [Flavobacterium sp.]
MKYFLTLILFISFTTINAQSNNTKEVKEALDWMQGKIGGIKTSNYFDMGAMSKNYWKKYNYKIEYKASDCSLKIIETESYVEDRNSSRNDRETVNTYEFNLSDISSIISEDSSLHGQKQFKIKTFNTKKTIHKTSKGVYNQDTQVDELLIYYTELGDLKDQPERFIKAFTDAVKFCGGGKTEKY